ncbi:N-(5'-phosphoribosyl)anthranilate isomerase [Xaviernesmea oryzae]|uniref:N-(5'-phosphoribosyl)anthranilate isomerase n=1 Tax=Xaviernesmea oryzae TaxID=464029 RepID=A0A1Q9AYC8_9HYPH|nr:phosphoribosylanthranilate isomerase [Xaviernesmea oryzae]OLP60420.1 N-(5'-phosphoribosyl)anthranilate isomerase [Xaviernesmea oryzae]SEK19312.1 phosphoribosylanthranilate isomerase [Xaviernesmea oryzae]
MSADPFDIKICGLKTREAAEHAVGRGATHIGFIFFPKSPRNVTPMEARAVADAVRGRAKIVAVTVDASEAQLDAIMEGLRPDMIQLHGGESPAHVQAVKARYGLPVIKALSIRDAADLEAALAYQRIADRLLFDAKPPKGSELPGGNGVSFDWRLLDALDDGVDYMLSGGLDAANVGRAISATHVRAIDASSGLEIAPGVKDAGRIDAFFDAVASALKARAVAPHPRQILNQGA